MKEFFGKITRADIRNIIALVVVIGCFVLLYIMTVKEIPKENKDLLNIVCGFIFGGGFGGVIGFYFGSTKTDADTKSNNNQNKEP